MNIKRRAFYTFKHIDACICICMFIRVEGCHIHPGRQRMYQKRPTNIKRALPTSRDFPTTYMHKKMHIHVCMEGCNIHPIRQHMYQKKPTNIKKDLYTSKET